MSRVDREPLGSGAENRTHTQHIPAAGMGGLHDCTDTDGMLERISGGLEHSSLHHRLALLDALVAWLCPEDSCEAISKPEARVLVRQLLSALCNPQYFERSWIVGLRKVIASATRSERCPTFTPMCVVNLAGGRANFQRWKVIFEHHNSR